MAQGMHFAVDVTTAGPDRGCAFCAVREAWATGCQQKGVAVCRFILSEDEITPQVHAC